MFNAVSGNSPEYLKEMIPFFRDTNTSLRSFDHLKLMDNSNIVSKYGKNCFELKGPKMWNILPYTRRNCDSVTNLKKTVKDIYFQY